MTFETKMNDYAHNNIPFIFILSYDMKESIIIPLDQAKAHNILYKVNEKTNYPVQPGDQKTGKKQKVITKMTPVSFDDYKIAYWCQFSGSRGMHLFAEIPLNISFNQKLDLSNILVKELADTLDLHTCDRASYNLRKVFKLCYTLNTKHGKTFVVLPLDDYMLNNFKLDYVTPEYVMKNIHLKNRGLLMRNGANINNTSNFINLLEALEIKITEKSDMRNI